MERILSLIFNPYGTNLFKMKKNNYIFIYHQNIRDEINEISISMSIIC